MFITTSFSQWPIPSPPKIVTFPSESPCVGTGLISCFDTYLVRHLTVLDLNVRTRKNKTLLPFASHKVGFEILSNANDKMTAIIGRLYPTFADNRLIFFVVWEFWFPILGRTGAAHRRSSTVSFKILTLGYAWGVFNYCTSNGFLFLLLHPLACWMYMSSSLMLLVLILVL